MNEKQKMEKLGSKKGLIIPLLFLNHDNSYFEKYPLFKTILTTIYVSPI
jgi:hypothetical protein